MIIKDGDTERYIQVVTQQFESGLHTAWYGCDEEFKSVGPPQEGGDERDEETFHRELRAEAAKAGDLVTSHCTDPEWNPEGYRRVLKEIEVEPETEDNGSS